jgi:ABC-type antimicrobial peptide transport system permease subunit
VEAYTVKKSIIYTLIAAILGLTLVLIPLITIRAQSEYNRFPITAFSEGQLNSEGRSGSTNVASSWSTEMGFIVISFVLALIAYLLVRSRMPRDDTVWTLHRPYQA